MALGGNEHYEHPVFGREMRFPSERLQEALSIKSPQLAEDALVDYADSIASRDKMTTANFKSKVGKLSPGDMFSRVMLEPVVLLKTEENSRVQAKGRRAILSYLEYSHKAYLLALFGIDKFHRGLAGEWSEDEQLKSIVAPATVTFAESQTETLYSQVYTLLADSQAYKEADKLIANDPFSQAEIAASLKAREEYFGNQN